MSSTGGWVVPGGGDDQQSTPAGVAPPLADRPVADGPWAPPVPPDPGVPRRRNVGLIVAGALAVCAIGLGAVAVATSDSGSDTERANGSRSAGDDPPQRPDLDTSAPSAAPETSEPPAVPADPMASAVRVEAPDGSFSLDLPATWVAGYPGSGSAAVGDQMFPGDPDAATRTAAVEAALVTPQTRMLALDPEGFDTVLPHHVLVVEGLLGVDPAVVGLDDLTVAAKTASDGATLGAEGRMPGPYGEISWFELTVAGGATSGVRYVVTGMDSVWLITFWSDDLAGTRATADSIVFSFDPGWG